MRYSHLTDDELWRGMAENSNAMSQIAKNQIDLAEGRIGMKDPATGAQLMISNVRQIAHLANTTIIFPSFNDAARLRRRGNRLIAALQEAVSGPKPKCRDVRDLVLSGAKRT